MRLILPLLSSNSQGLHGLRGAARGRGAQDRDPVRRADPSAADRCGGRIRGAACADSPDDACRLNVGLYGQRRDPPRGPRRRRGLFPEALHPGRACSQGPPGDRGPYFGFAGRGGTSESEGGQVPDEKRPRVLAVLSGGLPATSAPGAIERNRQCLMRVRSVRSGNEPCGESGHRSGHRGILAFRRGADSPCGRTRALAGPLARSLAPRLTGSCSPPSIFGSRATSCGRERTIGSARRASPTFATGPPLGPRPQISTPEGTSGARGAEPSLGRGAELLDVLSAPAVAVHAHLPFSFTSS